MTLSRKHYVELARILNETREDAWSGGYTDNERSIALASVARVEQRLVAYLQADNERFDTDRFQAAASKVYEEV
jgi:uncharacterized small protein (DUF1192 family)